MPTFTFTNNSGFDVFFYRITQSGTLIGEGNVTSQERTKTFVLDLPAGTELHFTTEMTMDLSSDGPVVYHDKGIIVDTYRTTGADRQTHTLRNISIELSIRNSSASPVFLFTVDPRSGNEVAAGSMPPHTSNFYGDRQGALKPSTIWRIKNAAGAVLKTYVTTTANRQEIEINANTLATMANYTHVQFISLEVYTGPNRGPVPIGPNGSPLPWPGIRDGIGYTGIGKENAVDNRLDFEGQIEDIEERLQFTYKAIEKAHELAVKHPTTLKVFMAPEFLYRGKGGAYIHDVINGWIETGPPDEFHLTGVDRFPGLFGYLKRFAADNKFKDWLFVFGTAISASFPARFTTTGGSVVDSTKMGEIYNTALIQRGGEFNTDNAYAARKRYISGIDFIKSQYKAKGFAGNPNDPDPEKWGTVVAADRLDLKPDESNREGSATFIINGMNDKAGQPIMFGLEVCLDHGISTPRNPQSTLWENNKVYEVDDVVTSPDDKMLYTCETPHTSSASPTTFSQDKKNNPERWVPYRNRWGRIRTADKWVKIQLVPSGGMHLTPASIRLLPAAGPTPHSYAFNCDGLTTSAGDLPFEYGAHTQIWNGANGTNPVPPENKLVNASYGRSVSTTNIAEVGNEIHEAANRRIKASDLWDLGSGYVRVMQEMPL